MRKLLLFSLLSLLMLTSCEEVIVLDLDEAERKPVVEANLNTTDGICFGTKAIGFFGIYHQSSIEKTVE